MQMIHLFLEDPCDLTHIQYLDKHDHYKDQDALKISLGQGFVYKISQN